MLYEKLAQSPVRQGCDIACYHGVDPVWQVPLSPIATPACSPNRAEFPNKRHSETADLRVLGVFLSRGPGTGRIAFLNLKACNPNHGFGSGQQVRKPLTITLES